MNLSLSRSDDVPVEWLDEGAVDTLARICESLGPPDKTASVVVVDDEYIRGLNARFRGKDRPTDVISFSYLEDDVPASVADDLAAEIFISYETIERDAAELDVDAAHLFLRMGVHGLLHVVGRDHATDVEAESMEREERDILAAHIGAGPADELF